MLDQTIHPPPQIISNDLLKEAKKERKKFLGRSRFPMAAECLRFFRSVPFFLFCIHTYILGWLIGGREVTEKKQSSADEDR